jgi:hypothetical protein
MHANLDLNIPDGIDPPRLSAAVSTATSLWDMSTEITGSAAP